MNDAGALLNQRTGPKSCLVFLNVHGRSQRSFLLHCKGVQLIAEGFYDALCMGIIIHWPGEHQIFIRMREEEKNYR